MAEPHAKAPMGEQHDGYEDIANEDDPLMPGVELLCGFGLVF